MWSAFRPVWRSSSVWAADVREMQQGLARRLMVGAAGLSIVGYSISICVPRWTDQVPRLFSLTVCYVALCLLGLKFLVQHPIKMQIVWMMGTMLYIGGCVEVFRLAAGALLLAVVPLAAALLLGWPIAAGMLLLAGVLAGTIFRRIGLSSLSPWQLAAALMISAGLGAVAGSMTVRSVADVVSGALKLWEQSRRDMEQVRDQRLEMKQVQEDLVLANQELSRLSDRLRQMWQIAQEARQAKVEFVANVSHELRTPLNMIIGFAELITAAPHLYGRDVPPALLADIGAVYTNAQHLARLVDDILDLSQIEAGRMALSRTWASIADIVREATEGVRALYEAKGLYLRVEMPQDMQPLYCDPIRIRQVLLNLLSNAARFVERGGTVVSARLADEEVVVSVSDTGQGVPADQIPKLFQPFSQVSASTQRRQHTQGSGLGLAISKQFIEMHGGRIWLESEVGRGSTFHFALPLGDSLMAGESASPSATRYLSREALFRTRTRRFRAPVPRSLPQFLVIENDAVLSRLLKRYVDAVQIESLNDAEQAVKSLSRAPASLLVIEGTWSGDSNALMQAVTTLPQAPPIVVCWLANEELASRDLHIAGYLPKPVQRNQLLGAIEQVGVPARTILIVDDEPEVLRLFTRMLSSVYPACRVLRAMHGGRALHLMRTERPDLVILDLVMPEVDGLEVLRQKTLDPTLQRIPVIVTSARGLNVQPVQAERLTVHAPGGLTLSQLIGCLEVVSGVTTGFAVSGRQERQERPCG